MKPVKIKTLKNCGIIMALALILFGTFYPVPKKKKSTLKITLMIANGVKILVQNMWEAMLITIRWKHL